MNLETENAGNVRDPSAQDIVDFLTPLNGFAILSRDELNYIQAAGNSRDGYVLEYQDGATDKHFACPSPMPIEPVIEAFTAYAQGNDSWRRKFAWQKLEIDRRGRWGCAGAAAVLGAPLAVALGCLVLAGCGQQPVGATLTFAVQPPASADKEVMKRAVVQTIDHRLNNAGRARSLPGAEVAADVYGNPSPDELDNLQRLLGTPGVLEFRILASRSVEQHQSTIKLAESLAADANDVNVDDRSVARWVEFSAQEFGGLDRAAERGLVVRLAGKTPQALIMLDDGLDVTGKHLRAASADVDQTGRPMVSFTFDDKGAFLFGQLTGNHLPTTDGRRYMLGILLDDFLLSAPTIESKITARGIISGGALNASEVKMIVNILNAGTLPCPVNLLRTEIIDRDDRE